MISSCLIFLSFLRCNLRITQENDGSISNNSHIFTSTPNMPLLRPVLAMGTALALVLLGTAALLCLATPSPWTASLSALGRAPRSLLEADGHGNAAAARPVPTVTSLAHSDADSAFDLPAVPAVPALDTQPAGDEPGAQDSFFVPPACDRASGAPALFRPTDPCSARALTLAAGEGVGGGGGGVPAAGRRWGASREEPRVIWHLSRARAFLFYFLIIFFPSRRVRGQDAAACGGGIFGWAWRGFRFDGLDLVCKPREIILQFRRARSP